VHPQVAGKRPRQGEVVAGHDDIEVGALAAKQRVAHRAADQIGIGPGAAGRRADALGARQSADPGGEALEVQFRACGHWLGSALQRRLRCAPYHDGLRG
jgi:hypothetical protein